MDPAHVAALLGSAPEPAEDEEELSGGLAQAQAALDAFEPEVEAAPEPAAGADAAEPASEPAASADAAEPASEPTAEPAAHEEPEPKPASRKPTRKAPSP